MGGEVAGSGGDEGGDATLHVDGAAAVERAVGDLRAERRMGPARFVTDRHHIRMTGKDEMPPAVADRGE